MSMLKKLIQSKGVKQKWLAEQIGVSEVTMSNWMKGKFKPTEENLRKIGEVLNIEYELLNDAINEI